MCNPAGQKAKALHSWSKWQSLNGGNMFQKKTCTRCGKSKVKST